MFFSRTSNILTNKTHECSFRLILNEHEISFVDLVWKNNGTRYHQRNTEILLPAVFNTTRNIASPIIEGLFISRPNNHNLRNFQELVTEKKRTVQNALETVSYCGPQLRSLLPEEIKSLTLSDSFKKVIKNLKDIFKKLSKYCFFKPLFIKPQ